MESDLLLFSLAEFRELIFECFRKTDVLKVAEVGAGGGQFTKELTEWAKRHEGFVYCIEPNSTETLKEICRQSDYARLIEDQSLNALPLLEPCDAYLLDSDHNYFTVTNELKIIEKVCSSRGLNYHVFVHDAGPPCGNRDFYFSPDSLPTEAVHPYQYFEDLVEFSIKEFGMYRKDHLTGKLAVAKHIGGPKNGVRTAVEDFVKDRPNLIFKYIPCIFGLAVIYSQESMHADQLTEYLNPYHNNPLLERIEANRMQLYIRYMKLRCGRSSG